MTTMRIAIVAQACMLANLLFAGIVYGGLWYLYLRHYAQAGPLVQQHIKQAVWVASISTGLFIVLNGIILLQGGYHTITALMLLEIYYMLIVPLFFIPGLMALVKAIQGRGYRYPLIGKWLK